MSTPPAPDQQYRAVLFDDSSREDRARLTALRADPGISVLDRRDSQRVELAGLLPVPDSALLGHPGGWAYYPWRRCVVGVLHAEAFRLVRLDRNRNKITRDEQSRLGRLRIGVAGLSVGHTIAHTLALEGLGGELRLADFDTLDLSNLNRIPATVFDLGLNKAVVAARRIAELNPYLEVSVMEGGVTAETMSEFCAGLDLVVEECDSLDIKVMIREEARRRGLPVLMETSDRGLLDVERFDLDKQRPLFHGLLGDIDTRSLAGLSAMDKVPFLLRLLDARSLSSRIAASMVEIGETISTWPQLGGDVVLGGATMAAAVRRLGLGDALPSGRIRIDLGEHLDGLDGLTTTTPEAGLSGPVTDAAAEPPTQDLAASVLRAVGSAPSGGNIQPWRVAANETGVRIYLAEERTTRMDVAHRGSYVAIGAALFNARIAASAASALGLTSLFPDPTDPSLVAELRFEGQDDPRLTQQHAAMLRRGTNRNHGTPQRVEDTVARVLHEAAESEGARLHLITSRSTMTAAGEVLGAADRTRYLTPQLHTEMMSELAWPGRDRLDVGIDVRTLELDVSELAKLEIIRRRDVMAHLASWGKGHALGTDTRDRIASSSAIAVVTVDGSTPHHFVQGGSAVEAVWICAERNGLAVQPVSPVFLYGLDSGELQHLSPTYAEELADLQRSFHELAQIESGRSIALVMRLSHAGAATVRSQRLPIADFTYRGTATRGNVTALER